MRKGRRGLRHGVEIRSRSYRRESGRTWFRASCALGTGALQKANRKKTCGNRHSQKYRRLAARKRFHVVDVRWTRDASQGDLAAINEGSTAAAVKVGKQLGVSYVLTGTVVEYTPQGADGFGLVILKTQLVEVATGKVKHAGETTQRSTSAMRTNGAAEMHTKAVRPALEKLTATLAGLTL